MKNKKVIIVIWLTIIFSGIAYLFWHNEFVYSLPTPVPKNYKVVNRGDKITIPEIVHSKNNKPLFLHFFNPDCPCSRFNITHFKTLVKEFGNEVNFSIIVISKKKFTPEEIQTKFDVNLPVFFDSSIAASCGVYSTLQAVIINTDKRLYYRGNYNRSRYCADKRSNYAQQALDSLLHNHTMFFNQFALKAYGCTLPDCTK